MATDQTRAEAADPSTPPVRLQELATADRDLWTAIAANPAAYDALLAWMSEHGDDEVRAVIDARGSAGTTPTTVLPSAPAPGPSPLAPPPAAGEHSGGTPLPPPGAAVAPGTPSGSGGSRKGLWITLAIIVALLLAAGIGVGVWALTKDDDDKNDNESSQNKDDDKDNADDEDKDRDKDGDRDRDRDRDKTSDICDDIYELDSAAFDIYLYYPAFDDPNDLEDAVAVLEKYRDDAPRDLANAIDDLIDYADVLAGLDQYDEIPTKEEDAAADAYDTVFSYYIEC